MRVGWPGVVGLAPGAFEVVPLPHDPLPMVPMLPGWLLPLLQLIALLVALTLVGLVGQRFGRGRRRAQEVRGLAAPAEAPAGLPEALGQLETEALAHGRLREGCHALATLIRNHLAQVTGVEVETMTSSEVGRSFENPRIGRWMTALAHRRFGRAEPSVAQFRTACTEARELFAQAPAPPRVRRGRRPS